METLLQKLYNKQLEIQWAIIEERKTWYDMDKQYIKELFVELENIIEELWKYRYTFNL